MGKEGKYDLKLAEPPAMSDAGGGGGGDSDTDSEETAVELDDDDDDDSAEILHEPIQPAKLIKTACVQFLRFFSISFGLRADRVQECAARNFSSFLRDIVSRGCCSSCALDEAAAPATARAETALLFQDQYEDWASLGFLRAALASTPASCRLMAKRAWVDLLFRIAEGGHDDRRALGSSSSFSASASSSVASNLPTQIMSLRLLASILPQCSREEPTRIQERLFRLLGHSALMCRVDGSHYGDQGLLQKVRKGRGTRVALTAAHSSTVAEECIRVVRKLHSTAEWGGKINDYACLKLSLVSEIVAEIPILQMQLEGGKAPTDLEDTSTGGRDDFTAQQSSIVASLALIGGFDARPRLGGLVSTPDAGKGVVCRINARGKLLVQLLETNELKKLPLQLLRRQDDRHFRLDKFVRSEDAVRIATSLFTLISQDFRIDKDKWRMLSDNSDSINLALLRQQQLRLAVVKAVKMFFGHQNTLRLILRQTVAVGATSMENMGVSEDFGGDPISRDPGDSHRREILLIQSLLAKATHPSPVKAIFAAEELESAALAVSQYLASAVAAKKTGSGSPAGAGRATPATAAQHGSALATTTDVDNDEARPMETGSLRRDGGCRQAQGGNSIEKFLA